MQKWSNLELAWQNWYDELHSTGEQSQDLSDQYASLKQTMAEIEPIVKEILPASVTVETLESDLKQLQVRPSFPSCKCVVKGTLLFIVHIF